MKSKLALSTILLFSFASANAGNYRQCMKDKMQATISAKPCQFDSYIAGENTAQSACGSQLMDEMMSTPGADMTSPDFQSSLDNKKRAGMGDLEAMIAAEGKRCGVTAKASGNKINVESKGSN